MHVASKHAKNTSNKAGKNAVTHIRLTPEQKITDGLASWRADFPLPDASSWPPWASSMSFLVGSPTLIPRKRSRRFGLLVPSYFESEISHGSPVEGGCTPRVMFALEEVVVHCEIGVLAKDSLESTAQNQVCCKKSTVYVQSVNLGLGVATADTFMS
jgi:hypothetical protein